MKNRGGKYKGTRPRIGAMRRLARARYKLRPQQARGDFNDLVPKDDWDGPLMADFALGYSILGGFMPKIYLYCIHGKQKQFYGFALAEDGNCLAEHLSSTIEFSKSDMGLYDDDWSGKREKYAKHYPNGYELEWIDDDKLESHKEFQVAFAKNKAPAADSDSGGKYGN